MLEQNTMRKVDETTIVLDGLIWSTNTDKAIKIINNESGYRVHSIRFEDIYYYPIGIDKNNKNKSYTLVIEKP